MKQTSCERSKILQAKRIFATWCLTWNNTRIRFTTRNGTVGWMQWTTERMDPACLDYPLVATRSINSVAQNWDVIWPGLGTRAPPDFIPTEDECMQLGMPPLATVDIVLTNKGNPIYFIDVMLDNSSISPSQKEMLETNGVNNFFTIDATWIINQGYTPPETIIFQEKII